MERRKPRGKPYLVLLVLLPVLLLASPLAWQRVSSVQTDQTQSASPPVAGPQLALDKSQEPLARALAANDKIVRDGLAVSFSVSPAGTGGEQAEAGDSGTADLLFLLTDAASGEPVDPPDRPAVWVDLVKDREGQNGKEAPTCEDKVRSFLQGSLAYRPDIDLNTYYVLALNEDASISVIDPLLGVSGISQLYTMVNLKDVGEDWAFSADGRLLFVSLSRVGQVAVVDTDSFKVIKNVDVGVNPVRVALQPGGKYLWVGNESHDRRSSGVTVIDTETLEVRATIRTGSGSHDMLFVAQGNPGAELQHTPGHHGSSTSGYTGLAFVTNREDGTLSIVDAQSFVKVHDIGVGGLANGLAFSSVANAVYVGSEADESVTVVDAMAHEVVGKVKAERGINSLRFAPGGRWGFALSPGHKTVGVLDASANRFVADIEVGGEPDSVAFTRDYAYIHSPGTAEVSLVDLAKLGQPALPAVTRIIGGQKAPGDSPFRSVADPIVSLHANGTHVLIANPADSYIYYYMEGMAAPMGGFQNYERTPRAVAVVDRSIRQVGPGAYWGRIKPPTSGKYQVAFLLDSPRIVNCFEFTAVEAAPASGGKTEGPLRLELLGDGADAKAGERIDLRFALADPKEGSSVAGLSDLQVVVALASGLWSERFRADSVGDGVYAISLVLPRPGQYAAMFAAPSRGLSFDRLPTLSLRATAGSTP